MKAASTSTGGATRTSSSSTCVGRIDRQGRGRAARRRQADQNRNTVPFDEQPPTVASGVRITPAATMRGFVEDDFAEVGEVIVEALGEDADVAALAARSAALCDKHPPSGIPRLHDLRRVTAVATERLIVVEHPLVQHKLSYLREKERRPSTSGRSRTRSRSFSPTRATKDFPTEDVETRGRSNAPRSSGSRERRSPSARCSAPGWGCSTGCSRSSRARASASSGFTATRRRSSPSSTTSSCRTTSRTGRSCRPDARDRQLERRGDREGQGRRRPDGHARLSRRGAGGNRARARRASEVRIVTASVDRGLNEKGYTSGPRRRRRPVVRHEVESSWTLPRQPGGHLGVPAALVAVLLLTPLLAVRPVHRRGGRTRGDTARSHPSSRAWAGSRCCRDLRAGAGLPRAGRALPRDPARRRDSDDGRSDRRLPRVAVVKLGGQIAAGAVAVGFGVTVDRFTFPGRQPGAARGRRAPRRSSGSSRS